MLCPVLKPNFAKFRASSNAIREILCDYIKTPACKRLINRILVAQAESNVKSIAILSQYSDEERPMFISALALGYLTLLNKRVLIVDTISQRCEDSFYFQGTFDTYFNDNDDAGEPSPCVDIITTKNLKSSSLIANANGSSPRFSYDSAQLDGEQDNAICTDFLINPFIDSMKKFYDLILMDACAINEVDSRSQDPFILAEYSDTTIIFTSQHSLQRENLSDLARDLKRHRISPLGIVIHSGASDELR